MSVMPVVIDTDPGIDDLVALALALSAPEIHVIAITTSYGNAPLDLTTRNLGVLLGLLRQEYVPALPGADRPLVRHLETAAHVHGPSGAGYAPVTPAVPVRADPRGLCGALELTDEPITLVTLGPLTNLALALQADDGLVRSRVQRHVGMFGSVEVAASPDRPADFNAWSDPEALAQVLEAGLDTTMVGLDVTHRLALSADDVSILTTARDPLISWLGHGLRFYVESHNRRGFHYGCRVHDVLPVAELIAPGLLTLAERRLTVDLDDGEHRGCTVPSARGASISTAVAVDLTLARALLKRVFPVLISPQESERRRRA